MTKINPQVNEMSPTRNTLHIFPICSDRQDIDLPSANIIYTKNTERLKSLVKIYTSAKPLKSADSPNKKIVKERSEIDSVLNRVLTNRQKFLTILTNKDNANNTKSESVCGLRETPNIIFSADFKKKSDKILSPIKNKPPKSGKPFMQKHKIIKIPDKVVDSRVSHNLSENLSREGTLSSISSSSNLLQKSREIRIRKLSKKGSLGTVLSHGLSVLKGISHNKFDNELKTLFTQLDSVKNMKGRQSVTSQIKYKSSGVIKEKTFRKVRFAEVQEVYQL